MRHWVASSNQASPLKLTARARMRPSISGRATFMAMSRAERPPVPVSHASSVPPAKIACRTGTPGRSRGVGWCWAACGEETAKEVALITTAGGASANKVASVAAETGSLSEATKTGSGFRPSARQARTSRLTGCSPAPWTSAR